MKSTQNSSSASRRAFYAGKKLLAIALVNFEGTVKGYLKRKEPAASDGGVAQLGEHLLCKQGVRGSIPLISTITVKKCREMEEGP